MSNIVLWCIISNRKTLKFLYLLVWWEVECGVGAVAAATGRCIASLRFMFVSRRKSLIRRLCKLCVGGEGGNVPPTTHASSEALFRSLEERQLEMLLLAVENRGADLSQCVLIPRWECTPGHVVSCRAFRWSDVEQEGELHRHPECRSKQDPVYICCNPYHWTRLCQPECPPPPYCRFPSECLKPEDRAPSENICDPLRGESVPVSLTTDGQECLGEWCRLAYWQLSARVGRQVPVHDASVNVFTRLPHGDGVSLEVLAAHCTAPDPVLRTRAKIGLGMTLSLEEDGVWLYNRSEQPLFVNSPLLPASSASGPVPSNRVLRVPSGYCLHIFDRTRPHPRGWERGVSGSAGPVDLHSVRISFGKGWGPSYARQDITSCPCWLEVLLKDPCR